MTNEDLSCRGRQARPRRRAAALLLAGAVVLVGCGSAAAVNRSDPAATATVFLQRYEMHDPTVCELAAAALRPRLDRDGRCGGAASGASPTVTVLDSRTCGDRHSFSAQLDPAGELGTPYVTVGLQRDGDQWSARSVQPLTDRGVISAFACAGDTEYGS